LKTLVIKRFSIPFFFVVLFLPFVLKAETGSDTHENSEKKDVSAQIVEHIMYHVSDANEYHIATFNGNPIAFPLPCILYRKSTSKLSVFLSSAFHEKHEIDGYKFDHESGRIVDAETGKRDTFIDLSVTKNVFHMMLGFAILAVLFISIKNSYTNRTNAAPKGLQGLMEPVIIFLTDEIFIPILGKDKYLGSLPYLLSVFFFILINNLLGLVPFFPGGSNASGNIAFTMVLACCSFALILINGTKHYWRHIFAMPGVPLPVLIILTPIEILGVFLRPAVLMLRLFGNITGGHIAVLSIASLIFILGENGAKVGGAFAGTALAIPIMLFVSSIELLVAFLQAFVFTLLSAIFISMAMEEHLSEEHH
jgi:F-type H+-transporting ATPase subunit a